MPEHEHEARQLALLNAYERALADDLAALPPPDLDPDLATVALALARHLGGPPPGHTSALPPGFRATLRRRLEEQAVSPAVPARVAPPQNGRYGGVGNPAIPPARRASFGPRDTVTPTPSQERLSAAPLAAARTDQSGTAPPRRRPYRAARATSVGWFGALVVFLVVLLVATRLLRDLPGAAPVAGPLPLATPRSDGTPTITATAAPTPAVAPTAPRASATSPLAAPRWQPTGALATARAQHTATRLADGRILVAGGHSNGNDDITASAELYDPRTGQWSATGAMVVPRAGQGAILLSDGRVLIVGGFNYRQYNNTTRAEGAELYDPATGRWNPTAPLPVGFTPRALALLTDGRVLAASGPDSTVGNETTVTLYDPALDRWTVAGHPNLPDIAAAVTLRDGTVLLIGEVGQTNDDTTPALRFDLVTGQWVAVAPLPGARAGYSASPLPDGRVLVAGGISFRAGGATVLGTTALFDPASGTWAETAALIAPRAGHVAAILADGRVLVVGGNNGGGQEAATAELYSLQSRTWTALGSTGGRVGRAFAVAPLADGRALVIGGDAGFVRSEWLAEVRLLTPLAAQRVTTGGGSGIATPKASDVGNWGSPNAGLLFYGGRGYRLREQTLPDGSAPRPGAQIGTAVLPLQSGGVFPAGTPMYAVAGQSSEEWLALRDGARVVLYRQEDSTTALLAGFQVVIGRVASDGAMVCPAYGCPAAPSAAQLGTVATANRLVVERALRGSVAAGEAIEVRQMGVAGAASSNERVVAFLPGQRVLLFLQPAQRQSVGDFAGGDYYWTGAGWAYGFVDDQIVPLGGAGGVAIPLDRFEAALVELFAAVTPLAPTDPRPTPRPVPTPTGFVPAPTATRPAPTALPTPTPGP